MILLRRFTADDASILAMNVLVWDVLVPGWVGCHAPMEPDYSTTPWTMSALFHSEAVRVAEDHVRTLLGNNEFVSHPCVCTVLAGSHLVRPKR